MLLGWNWDKVSTSFLQLLIDCLLVAGALWKWAYTRFTPLFRIWKDATGESIPDDNRLTAVSPVLFGSPP